jgi:hypothetical protein
MNAANSMEDRPYFKQAVAEAKADYDKALAKWESASLEDKSVRKEILDSAKDLLCEANKNLLAFLKTLPQGSVVQRAPSPGPLLGSLELTLVLVCMWIIHAQCAFRPALFCCSLSVLCS